ncbi:MAG: CDP-alcohol phosphatidyltransferase family protein [Bacteroidetes bacterium]|nr:CDP-alcohol phosphatidyltransferase family protein [Bacteroidota bacterium]
MNIGSKGFKWNVPNILSLYRLCSFPILLIVIFSHHQTLFVWLFAINLITDILDGFIARKFNMQTEIGAMLDSYADLGSVILAVIAIYIFKWNEFSDNLTPFIIYMIFYFFSVFYAFLKFREIPAFHLYSFKFMGYLQGTFLFVLFVFGFYKLFYSIVMYAGVLACIEEIVLIYLLPKPIHNIKSIYWFLKSKQI